MNICAFKEQTSPNSFVPAEYDSSYTCTYISFHFVCLDLTNSQINDLPFEKSTGIFKIMGLSNDAVKKTTENTTNV